MYRKDGTYESPTKRFVRFSTVHSGDKGKGKITGPSAFVGDTNQPTNTDDVKVSMDETGEDGNPEGESILEGADS